MTTLPFASSRYGSSGTVSVSTRNRAASGLSVNAMRTLFDSRDTSTELVCARSAKAVRRSSQPRTVPTLAPLSCRHATVRWRESLVPGPSLGRSLLDESVADASGGAVVVPGVPERGEVGACESARRSVWEGPVRGFSCPAAPPAQPAVRTATTATRLPILDEREASQGFIRRPSQHGPVNDTTDLEKVVLVRQIHCIAGT